MEPDAPNHPPPPPPPPPTLRFGRCRTCTHWERMVFYGACNAVRHISEPQDDEHVGFYLTCWNRDESSPLITHPKFGCAAHEEKEVIY